MGEDIIREEPFEEHGIEDKVEPTMADAMQRVYPQIKALGRFSAAIDQNALDRLYALKRCLTCIE